MSNNKTIENMKTVMINNRNFQIEKLEKLGKKVYPLVLEYLQNPNCHPPVWIGKKEGLNEIEEASFIYHSLKMLR
jgi:hypothetical protein